MGTVLTLTFSGFGYVGTVNAETNISDEKDKVSEKLNDVETEILKERLSSYQNRGGDVGYMEVIFGSKGFDEFISRFTAVTTITKADNKLIEEQKTAINKVEQKESQVKEKLSETEKNKEELKKINKEQK